MRHWNGDLSFFFIALKCNTPLLKKFVNIVYHFRRKTKIPIKDRWSLPSQRRQKGTHTTRKNQKNKKVNPFHG
jgi:hypothetical protein